MNATRALYIEHGVACAITLDQGVAPRIETPNRAPVWYPLQRLGRVQSTTQARWHIDALLACLRHGIPVVFTDRKGQTIAWCYGARRRELTLTQLLRDALRQADWPDFWRAWTAQTERAECEQFQRRHRLPGGRNKTLQQLHVRAVNHMQQRWQRPPGPWLRATQQAVATLVSTLCYDAVGDPTLLHHARPGLNIPAELARLLQGRVDTLLLSCGPKDLQQQAPTVFAAKLLDTRRAELHRACARMLADLEYCLREWTS